MDRFMLPLLSTLGIRDSRDYAALLLAPDLRRQITELLWCHEGRTNLYLRSECASVVACFRDTGIATPDDKPQASWS